MFSSFSRGLTLFWYHIKGDKKGVYDLFADNLPGLPDNIRVSSDGGYWIAMAAVQKFPFSLLHYLGPYPSIRKSITKIVPQKMILKLLPKYSLLIKLDHRGDIIKSYHDPSGTTITEVSQAHEDVKERVLYLGSYQAKFIAKLKL